MREGLLGPSSFWWPNCFILNKDYGRRAGIQTASSRPSVVEALPPGHLTIIFLSHQAHLSDTTIIFGHSYSRHSHLAFVSYIYCTLFIITIFLSKLLEIWSSQFHILIFHYLCPTTGPAATFWSFTQPNAKVSFGAVANQLSIIQSLLVKMAVKGNLKQNTEKQITQCDAVWCWGLI